jgi:hypothetical protein
MFRPCSLKIGESARVICVAVICWLVLFAGVPKKDEAPDGLLFRATLQIL